MPDVLAPLSVFVVGPSAFPTTPEPTRLFEEEAVWPDVSITFEAEYSQSWPMADALRPRRITLDYELRPRADFDTALSHWNSVAGMEGAFAFAHPRTAERWFAQYAMEELVPDWRHTPNLYSWRVALEEVAQ